MSLFHVISGVIGLIFGFLASYITFLTKITYLNTRHGVLTESVKDLENKHFETRSDVKLIISKYDDIRDNINRHVHVVEEFMAQQEKRNDKLDVVIEELKKSSIRHDLCKYGNQK